MSLSKEKIVENTTKYINTAKKNGFLTGDLEDLLGVEFISAPASTMEKLHNAFEGGLIDHILRVMRHAYHINENNLIDELKIPRKSLTKVVYLHAIGKAKLYSVNESEWHRNNQGKMYNFNEDLVSMRVGERSAHYALSTGVILTDEEFAAIVNYDKVEDAMSQYHNSTVGDVLKMAVRLAIMEEQSLAK